MKHRIGWSQTKESIIFPVFDPDNGLLMWQARYFGENKKYPKYLTKGNKGDILHVLGEYPTGRVVLVEDLVSAIVVARVENSMPLWGSTFHLKIPRQLAHTYSTAVLWLDSDKLENSLRIKGPASLIFDGVTIVNTPKDPKFHNTDQVREILGKTLDKGTEY